MDFIKQCGGGAENEKKKKLNVTLFRLFNYISYIFLAHFLEFIEVINLEALLISD